MSTAQFTTPLITVIPGQLITASGWNAEFDNFFTNLNPLGIGAYSDTDAQMQTSTDPFPSGTSRPTSLGGELERIRYILNLIIGKTYWYQHPSISLETLNTSTPVIPSGTVMPFYQAAAPTGWTIVNGLNSYVLRVDAVNGGTSANPSGSDIGDTVSLAHSHTVASHTHDLANHTHTMGNHTHSTPNHQHQIESTGVSGQANLVSTFVGSLDSDGGALIAGPTSVGGINYRHHTNRTENSGSGTSGVPSTNTTGTPSSNTSGATAPSTDSQLTNITFKIANVILCSKN